MQTTADPGSSRLKVNCDDHLHTSGMKGSADEEEDEELNAAN